MSTPYALAVLLLTAVAAFAVSFLIRRWFPALRDLDIAPWASTLSYVATAYGVVVGFTIIFLFGEFSDARTAVGNEATSIGTAFEEARLFPESAVDVQHALICYGRAVPEYDWPALRKGESAPQVDTAYRDIILALGEADEPTDGTFQPATATNVLVQVGNISTAREARIVTAEVKVPVLLWGFLFAGGLFVIALIFVVTLKSHRVTQAALVSASAVFTAVMLAIVVALATPYHEGGGGRVTPELIEETTASMEAEVPDAATPCSFEDGA